MLLALRGCEPQRSHHQYYNGGDQPSTYLQNQFHVAKIRYFSQETNTFMLFNLCVMSISENSAIHGCFIKKNTSNCNFFLKKFGSYEKIAIFAPKFVLT